MSAQRLGYFNTPTTAGALVKSGPAGLFGVISTATGGLCTIYDGVDTSGTVLLAKTLAAGDVVSFGNFGIAAKKGLYIVVTGTVNVLYS